MSSETCSTRVLSLVQQRGTVLSLKQASCLSHYPQSIQRTTLYNLDVLLFSVWGMNKYFISYHFRDPDSHVPRKLNLLLSPTKVAQANGFS